MGMRDSIFTQIRKLVQRLEVLPLPSSLRSIGEGEMRSRCPHRRLFAPVMRVTATAAMMTPALPRQPQRRPIGERNLANLHPAPNPNGCRVMIDAAEGSKFRMWQMSMVPSGLLLQPSVEDAERCLTSSKTPMHVLHRLPPVAVCKQRFGENKENIS